MQRFINSQFSGLATSPLSFKIFFILIMFFTLSACSEPPYTNIDNAQLKELLEQGVPIYDVRRIDEWKQTGVIQGSKLLTIIGNNARVNPDFMRKFSSEIDKDSPVILICRTGSRTHKLATHLMENLGYTNIYNVRNGITQWISEGNPIAQVRF